MFKSLTAATLSLALVFTSLPTAPAKAADAEDIAPVLFGLGLLAVLAASSSGNADTARYKSQKPKKSRKVTRASPQPYTVIEPANRNGHAATRRAAANHKTIPNQCARKLRFSSGTRTYFLKGCLESKGVRTSRLPNHCERVLDIPGHRVSRTGWHRACLKNSGYRVR